MFNNYSIFYFDELLTSWTTLSVPLACAVLCGRPRGLSERQLNCVQIDCRREVLAVSPSSKSESSGQAPEHSARVSRSARVLAVGTVGKNDPKVGKTMFL